MAVVISIISLKGGVAKTTTALSLGFLYAAKGNRVLLVDLDPKATLTHSSIDVSEVQFKEGLHNAVLHGESLPVVMVRERLGISPSGGGVTEVDGSRRQVVETGFRSLLLELSSSWDVIIFDTPAYPSESMRAVARLSDRIVVPVRTDSTAIASIDATLGFVQCDPRLVDILLVQHDRREKHSVYVEGAIREMFPESVMDSTVRRNVALSEAATERRSIFEYRAESKGASDYAKVAEELHTRIIQTILK